MALLSKLFYYLNTFMEKIVGTESWERWTETFQNGNSTDLFLFSITSIFVPIMIGLVIWLTMESIKVIGKMRVNFLVKLVLALLIVMFVSIICFVLANVYGVMCMNVVK